MSGVAGIGGYLSTNNVYQQLSSGKKINSAADDAAGMAIANREKIQANGYEVGSGNMESAKNMLNVSDAALSGISDYLNSIRDLAVQASNGLLNQDDKESIQNVIDQYKQGITDIANGTTFNGKKLLDGSESGFSIASDANGTNREASTVNATLESLGIADFNVTGDFDLKTIDDAIKTVQGARTSIGAQTNALDYAINYNGVANQNAINAVSRQEDTDYEKKITEMKKKEALDTYAIMMQKKQSDANAGILKLFE